MDTTNDGPNPQSGVGSPISVLNGNDNSNANVNSNGEGNAVNGPTDSLYSDTPLPAPTPISISVPMSISTTLSTNVSATETPSTPAAVIPANTVNLNSRPPKTPPVPPGTFPSSSHNGRPRHSHTVASASVATDGVEMSRMGSDVGSGAGSVNANGNPIGLGLSSDLVAGGSSTNIKMRKEKEEEPVQLPLLQATWGMPPSLYVKAPISTWAKTDSSLFVTRTQADVEDPDHDSDPEGEAGVTDLGMEYEEREEEAEAEEEVDAEGEEGASHDEERSAKKIKLSLVPAAMASSQPIRSRTAYRRAQTVQRRHEELRLLWEEEKRMKQQEKTGNDVSVEGGEAKASEEEKINTHDTVSENESTLAGNGQVERTRPTPNDLAEKVIVIHPGSRFLRIGRSTDTTPIHIRNAIYRKKPTANRATGGAKEAGAEKDGRDEDGEKNGEGEEEKEPNWKEEMYKEPERLDELITLMRDELRQRMKAAKLKVPPGKPDAPSNIASRYNSSQKPVEHPIHTDPYSWDWVEDYTPDKLFPDPNLHLPADAPYELRYPIKRRDFNVDDYDASKPQVVLSDQQDILEHALTKLKVPVLPKDYWRYSIVLVHPDHTNKPYLTLWAQLLLQTMGFREIGFLAESVCATIGAGLSSACIVDVGATRTTVACVDDGLVLNETRFILDYGADDITNFYHHLLTRISFPYKELDIKTPQGWEFMDEQKRLTNSLVDAYVASNVWKCFVREKGKGTKEYQYQTYDQPLLAPSSLFDPRAFNWASKPFDPERRLLKNDPDQMAEMKDDGPTAAMEIAVQHLRPAAPAPPAPAPAPAPAASAPPVPAASSEVTAATAEVPVGGTEPPVIQEQKPAAAAAEIAEGTIDIASNLNPTNPETTSVAPSETVVATEPLPLIPQFDVLFESRKTPLDLAIACSLIAAKDKGPGVADAILILGGTGLMDGLQAALQERVTAQCAYRSLIPMKPATLPPPRGLEERIVTWRGAGVYSRLESMTEFWIKRQEWMDIGIKSYRNRMY